METQVGLELCTAGTAEKMTVNGRCAIFPGIMMIHSPLFPMLELGRSVDYASVILTVDIMQRSKALHHAILRTSSGGNPVSRRWNGSTW